MADEFKTLLKIDGDASGAKKAAEETKAATQSVGAAEQRAAAQTAEATQKAGEALEEKKGKTDKAKTGFDKLAESMGVTRQQTNEFKEAVSRVSPELGGLLNVAMKGEGIFKTLFTGIGAATIGAIAAVQALSYVLQEAEASAQRALAETEKVAAMQDKVRGRERARGESVEEGLARAGKVSDAATGAARGIEQRMTQQGFDAEAIRKVLPYAVDEAGQQTLSDDEIANLAAMETYGKGQLDFDKPKQMDSVLRRAKRTAKSDAGLVAKWRDAIERRRTRQTEAASQMDRSAMAEILGDGVEAVPDDQMDEAIADIESVRTTGRVSTDTLGKWWPSGDDRLIWERRQRDAARRAHALGQISNEDAIRAGSIAGEQAADDRTMDDVTHYAGGVPSVRIGAAAIDAAKSAAGQAVSYITNNFNHGTINNGKPSTLPVQRGVAP